MQFVIVFRFGRKVALVISIIVRSIGVALSCSSPNYAAFIIGRFVQGIGVQSIALVSYVLGMYQLTRDIMHKQHQ